MNWKLIDAASLIAVLYESSFYEVLCNNTVYSLKIDIVMELYNTNFTTFDKSRNELTLNGISSVNN